MSKVILRQSGRVPINRKKKRSGHKGRKKERKAKRGPFIAILSYLTVLRGKTLSLGVMTCACASGGREVGPYE